MKRISSAAGIEGQASKQQGCHTEQHPGHKAKPEAGNGAYTQR